MAIVIRKLSLPTICIFPMMTEGLDSAPQLLERFAQADLEAQRKREHDSDMFLARRQAMDDAREKTQLGNQIKLMELGQRATESEGKLSLAQAKAEAAKEKLPAGLAEDEAYSKYKRQESALQTLVQSNPDRNDLKQMLGDVQNKIQSWELRHGGQEITVSTPQGEVIRVGKAGKQPGGLTVGETTRLGEDVQASANSLRVLNELEGQLNSNAVGVLPTINSVVFDRILGQFAPDVVSSQRVQARQNIGIATQQVLGELNNRGRFTNQELDAIKNLMPGLGGAESPARAKVALSALKKVLAEKGAHAATQLNRELPAEVLQTLSSLPDTELAEEVKKGAMTSTIFYKVYDYKHGRRP